MTSPCVKQRLTTPTLTQNCKYGKYSCKPVNTQKNGPKLYTTKPFTSRPHSKSVFYKLYHQRALKRAFVISTSFYWHLTCDFLASLALQYEGYKILTNMIGEKSKFSLLIGQYLPRICCFFFVSVQRFIVNFYGIFAFALSLIEYFDRIHFYRCRLPDSGRFLSCSLFFQFLKIFEYFYAITLQEQSNFQVRD